MENKQTVYDHDGYKTTTEESPFPQTITEEELQQFIANRENAKYLTESDKGELYPIPNLVKAYRAVFVDKDNMGAEDITFGITRFDPGSYHEKHAHEDAEEIMYILSGRYIGGVGDDEFLHKPGDVIFVPRGAVHWAYNPFDEPLVELFLYTKPSLESAGYGLESDGYDNIGSKVQDTQKNAE